MGLIMSNVRLRVNENGRVVIPASFRKALHIRPGDQVLARLEGGEVRITTLKHRAAPRAAVRQTRKIISGRIDRGASRGR